MKLLFEKSNLLNFDIPENVIKIIHENTTLESNAEFFEIKKKDLFKDYSSFLCVSKDYIYDEEYEDEEIDDDQNIVSIFIFRHDYTDIWNYIVIYEDQYFKIKRSSTKTDIRKLLTNKKFDIYATNAVLKREPDGNKKLRRNEFYKLFFDKNGELLNRFFKRKEIIKRKEIQKNIMNLTTVEMLSIIRELEFIIILQSDPDELIKKSNKIHDEVFIVRFLIKEGLITQREANYNFLNGSTQLNNLINDIGLNKTFYEFMKFYMKEYKKLIQRMEN